MKISLSIRIKPLQIEAMDSDELKSKIKQIWDTIVNLETDKYDFEQRHINQDYEFKELNERQKIQLRNKAIKKGLDPEAFTGAHPPKIRMFSKYERRTDTRTYGDRKKLYEGGVEIVRAEMLEAMWKEKFNEWNKRAKIRLPRWFGERPGKKAGDAETPEGGEEEEAAAEEAYEEEEDEEYEEDEDEEWGNNYFLISEFSQVFDVRFEDSKTARSPVLSDKDSEITVGHILLLFSFSQEI